MDISSKAVKRLLVAVFALAVALMLMACGEDPNKTKDLSGTWVQTDKQDDSWQEAVIRDDVITIDWVSDGGDTRSVYWVGTYKAPGKATADYKWTSARDKDATDAELLASTSDTKVFEYKDGRLSYKVSALGTETTVQMKKKS